VSIYIVMKIDGPSMGHKDYGFDCTSLQFVETNTVTLSYESNLWKS